MMDYAARLQIPQSTTAPTGNGLETLAGDYAQYLNGMAKPAGGTGSPLGVGMGANGFRLKVGNPDALPPEVATILQIMTGEMPWPGKPKGA